MASTTAGNILVIGMVTHDRTEELTTETSKRDQARVVELRKRFDTVFTMSQHCDRYDESHHAKAAMVRNGGKSLCDLMNREHGNKIIDYICLDYVRFPAGYYHSFLTGKTAVAGASLCDFILYMQKAYKLRDGCKLMFARCPSSDRWKALLTNLTKVFGKHKTASDIENPLYNAGEVISTQSEENPLYDHKKELKRHCDEAKPFCVFTVKMLKRSVSRMSALADVSVAYSPNPNTTNPKPLALTLTRIPTGSCRGFCEHCRDSCNRWRDTCHSSTEK